MGFLAPTPPPYDPMAWVRLPLSERAQAVCRAWALQGYGTPLGAYLFYALKMAAYVGGWLWSCGFSSSLGPAEDVARWWLQPDAFVRAMVWSMLFEGLGLGCGSGPLTGRYVPPFAALVHFAWPGTTKLPVFPGAPLVGGHRRTVLDAALYVALVVLSVRALVAPQVTPDLVLPLVLLVPVLGLLDRTVFLALRAEHFWTTLVCVAFLPSWLPGAQAVQLALWFFAGFSKLNHHFPTVVGVMVSNSPVTRWAFLRRRMYRAYPDDLRPSALATAMAHAGTALEMAIPLVLMVSAGSPGRVALAMVLMLMLHGFIASNVPMGVPLEWNVVVVYGAFALFHAHPDVSVWDLPMSHPVTLFLLVMLVGVPLAGNVWPHRISFLPAMRYYAGNWPYSVWLFRGDSHLRLQKLRKASPWVFSQLNRFYAPEVGVGVVGKVMAFRMMHLQGRVLKEAVPHAVERLEDCTWLDGELVAGMALGWNFGDGHLHHEQLLAALQAQCAFEPGELRCIFVEAEPLLRRTLAWRVVDAATGEMKRGESPVAQLRATQPW